MKLKAFAPLVAVRELSITATVAAAAVIDRHAGRRRAARPTDRATSIEATTPCTHGDEDDPRERGRGEVDVLEPPSRPCHATPR